MLRCVPIGSVYVEQTAPIIAHPPNRVNIDKRYGVSAGPGVDLFTGDVIVLTVEEINPLDQSPVFNVWAMGEDGEILCVDPIATSSNYQYASPQMAGVLATPQLYSNLGFEYPNYGGTDAEYLEEWSPSLVNMFVVNVIDGRLGLMALSPIVIFPKAPRYIVADPGEPRSGVANELTERPWIAENIQTLAVRSYLPPANAMYAYPAYPYDHAVFGVDGGDGYNGGTYTEPDPNSIGKLYIRASSQHGFCACSNGVVQCPHLNQPTIITPRYGNVDPIFSRFKINKVPQQVTRRLLENYFASVRQGVPRTFILLSQMPFIDRMDAIHFHGAEAQLASRRVYIAQIRVTTRGARLEQQSTLVLRNLVSDTIRFTFNIQFAIAPEITLGTVPIPIFIPDTIFPFSAPENNDFALYSHHIDSPVVHTQSHRGRKGTASTFSASTSSSSSSSSSSSLSPSQFPTQTSGPPPSFDVWGLSPRYQPFSQHYDFRTSQQFEHEKSHLSPSSSQPIDTRRKVVMNVRKLTPDDETYFQSAPPPRYALHDDLPNDHVSNSTHPPSSSSSSSSTSSLHNHTQYRWREDRERYSSFLQRLDAQCDMHRTKPQIGNTHRHHPAPHHDMPSLHPNSPRPITHPSPFQHPHRGSSYRGQSNPHHILSQQQYQSSHGQSQHLNQGHPSSADLDDLMPSPTGLEHVIDLEPILQSSTPPRHHTTMTPTVSQTPLEFYHPTAYDAQLFSPRVQVQTSQREMATPYHSFSTLRNHPSSSPTPPPVYQSVSSSPSHTSAGIKPSIKYFKPSLTQPLHIQLEIIIEVFSEILQLQQKRWLPLFHQQQSSPFPPGYGLQHTHNIQQLLAMFDLPTRCVSFIPLTIDLPSQTIPRSGHHPPQHAAGSHQLETWYFDWQEDCSHIHMIQQKRLAHHSNPTQKTAYHDGSPDHSVLVSAIDDIFHLLSPLMEHFHEHAHALTPLHSMSHADVASPSTRTALTQTSTILQRIVDKVLDSHDGFDRSSIDMNLQDDKGMLPRHATPHTYHIGVILAYIYYTSPSHQTSMKRLVSTIEDSNHLMAAPDDSSNHDIDDDGYLYITHPPSVPSQHKYSTLTTKECVNSNTNQNHKSDHLHHHSDSSNFPSLIPRPRQYSTLSLSPATPYPSDPTQSYYSSPSHFETIYQGHNHMKRYSGMDQSVLHGISPHIPHPSTDGHSPHQHPHDDEVIDIRHLQKQQQHIPNQPSKSISRHPGDLLHQKHINLITLIEQQTNKKHQQGQQQQHRGYNALPALGSWPSKPTKNISLSLPSSKSGGLSPPSPCGGLQPTDPCPMLTQQHLLSSTPIKYSPLAHPIEPQSDQNIGASPTSQTIEQSIQNKFFSQTPPILPNGPSDVHTLGKGPTVNLSTPSPSFFFQSSPDGLLQGEGQSSSHIAPTPSISSLSNPQQKTMQPFQDEEETGLFPGIIELVVFSPKVTVAFGIDADFGTVIEIAGDYALITPPASSNLGHVVQHIGYATMPFTTDLVRSEYWWYAQWIADMHLVSPPRRRSGFDEFPIQSIFSSKGDSLQTTVKVFDHHPSQSISRKPSTFHNPMSCQCPLPKKGKIDEEIVPPSTYRTLRSMTISSLLHTSSKPTPDHDIEHHSENFDHAEPTPHQMALFQTSTNDDHPPHVDDLEDECVDPFETDNFFDRFTIQKASIEKSLYSLINPLGILHPALELHHFALSGEYSSTNTFFVEFIVERVV